MKIVLSLFVLLITSVGFSQEDVKPEKAEKISGSYGYKEKDPIKVGGGDMPTATIAYLKRLQGPNGKGIYYKKDGKGTSYDNPDPSITRKEKGILYRYEIREDGSKKVEYIYFDQYRFEEPTPLKGYSWRD
jgi:hypothetical protein